MGVFPVERLTAGMVLASGVKDPFGRILIPAGQELLPRHIEVIRAYGIVEVDISGSDEIVHNDDGEIAPEVFAAAAEELSPRFRMTDLSWEVMKQIHRAAVIRIVRMKKENGMRS
jgi:hypothetical protein